MRDSPPPCHEKQSQRSSYAIRLSSEKKYIPFINDASEFLIVHTQSPKQNRREEPRNNVEKTVTLVVLFFEQSRMRGVLMNYKPQKVCCVISSIDLGLGLGEGGLDIDGKEFLNLAVVDEAAGLLTEDGALLEV